MIRLVSKVQYKNFEPGEFTAIQMRSLDETIELIEKFPWNSERDNIKIDLTNPSITIEGKNNDYLKFALYYNQKYVLHYFNGKQTLFTKSFIDLKDGYKYIRNYFEQSKFDATDFKKENTWLQNNRQHFSTKDFRYLVTRRSVTKYLLSTSGIHFCFSIAIIIFFIAKGFSVISVGMLIGALLIMFLMGGGLHLIFFFNYYNYVKDKILIMSKGNDTFYFGAIDDPGMYDKKDIYQYVIIKTRGSTKNPFQSFAIVEIELKNGTVLKIPNLLIDDSDLCEKLFEYPKVEVNRYPMLS